MAQQIEDGTGKRFTLKVDADGRAAVFATTLPEEHHVNQDAEKFWSVPFDAVDPTSNDDYFIHIKNTDTAVRVIPRVNITSTVAGFVELQRVTGTSVGGGDVVPVNATGGGSAPANLTTETGVDITGLVDGGVHHFHWLQANVTAHIFLPATIRLKQNEQFAILWTVSTGILTGTVEIYEEEVD